jgi:uncharacterized membrane protein
LYIWPIDPTITGQQLLANIPVFESLTSDELQVLAARLQDQFAEANDVVFRQGDPGSRLYLIADGAVQISYGEGATKIALADLFTGQYFGELSLFDGAPRSATATAVRKTHLMTLDGADVVDFVKRYPAASLRIIAEMSERLRQTNELMSRQVSRNVNEEAEELLTFGQHLADRVATFAGSWPFIFFFMLALLMWMGINVAHFAGFDPYPFVFLNLVLAVVTALQAPLIMMSQNRQSMKDKLLAENDYRVNLKAETEIATIMRMQTELLARVAFLERALLRKSAEETPKPQIGLVAPLSPE